MNGPRYRAWIERNWGPGHRLYLMQDDWGRPAPSGHGIVVKVATDFVWNETEEGMVFDRMDGISQADDLVQAIMDEGWKAGFRPRGFADVKNETEALRQHLSDMKTIAFHQLKIKA